jgi:hypothetical protein
MLVILIAITGTYIYHQMFPDLIISTRPVPCMRTMQKQIPVCLYAAGGIDSAVAFPNQPAEVTDEISNAKLRESLLRTTTNGGKVPCSIVKMLEVVKLVN